ncbi:MAG TPA: 4Fe-4S binding protein [Firmicutes bacterium]|nr:4Fe-4S binding protein [Bacillota bacterium]
MTTEVEFAGLKLRNPFVAASGPETSSIEKLIKCEDNGAAAVSTKLSLMRQPWPGQLRMYSVPGEASIVCHDRRLDMDEGFELVRRAKERTNLVIFVNITHPSEDLEGWQTLARGFEQAGADAIELNLICPNISFSVKRMGEAIKESHGAAIGQNPDTCYAVTKAVKEAVSIPVVPKLTPNVNDITVTALACERAGADGICIAGGQSALPKVDIYAGGKPDYPFLDGASFGSLGGPVCLNQSFALVAQAARALKIPVIGGGGISTWQDAIMMMMWGATLVTACTVIMWERFSVIRDIVNGMEKFLEEQGYSSFKDITGMSLKYLKASRDLVVEQAVATIDYDECIDCLKCVELGHCTAIVEQDGKAVVIPEECVGCAICVRVCPQGAIHMKAL